MLVTRFVRKTVVLKKEACIAYRDDLRNARAMAVSDAEGFQEILFAIERLGTAVLGKTGTLGSYQTPLQEIAKNSPLAFTVPAKFRYTYTPFNTLYAMVNKARNDAMHQGAYARHLTSHAIELSLVLEDALMCDCNDIEDYMVKTVIQAELWQSLAYLRQQMLSNSFSYLPLWEEAKGWQLVSDHSLAIALRSGPLKREDCLGLTLKEAIDQAVIAPLPAKSKIKGDGILSVLKGMSEASMSNIPILITHPKDLKILLGIVTAFDLM